MHPGERGQERVSTDDSVCIMLKLGSYFVKYLMLRRCWGLLAFRYFVITFFSWELEFPPTFIRTVNTGHIPTEWELREASILNRRKLILLSVSIYMYT